MHSHFNIDKTPPPLRRPNAAAIQSVGEALQCKGSRSRRSLQTCHRPAMRQEQRPYSGNSDAFVPQLSARLINDPGLNDGARRCAIKIMELVYRRNRQGRALRCTVSYLAKCLQRSERSVQNYLAQLRSRGYIRHDVIASEKARMCIGILITVLRPLFPKHHAAEWPHRAMQSGVKKDSENYRPNIKHRHEHVLGVEFWALRCMEGVFRALMTTARTAQAGPA